MSTKKTKHKTGLRPCPVCGAPAEYVEIGVNGYAVRCSRNKTHIHIDRQAGLYSRKHDAKRAWNRRYIEDTLHLEMFLALGHVRRAKTLKEAEQIVDAELMYLQHRCEELGLYE